MKNIVILGSTGSIGRNALSVVSNHGKGTMNIVGLTANSSTGLLLEQIEQFGPEVVAVANEEAAEELRKKTQVEVLSGQEGLCRVASWERADFVLSAIVGAAGLVPTMAAVRAGRAIGLANKETLVVGGNIVMEEAARSGARILPVDSEHSAVFQCLEGRGREYLRRIILTASGGPFVGMSTAELEKKTPEDALRHPSWSMGRKITVDSATLMNKGLEVIEAHYLFGVSPDRIDVAVHPQSIIHSIVEFIDGCSLAHMSVPDMRAAIAYAMTYPERMEGVIEHLDLSSVGKMTFAEPDKESFPCLSYAYDALAEGGTMPAVLNGANEAAVAAFLEGGIGFNDIPAIIKMTMQDHEKGTATTIEDVTIAHDWAISKALELIGTLALKPVK
jgi:1-deoxy-D-xylulose-5-phosphate reductoisomerase